MTESLAYDLQPLRVAGSDETWTVASCNNARIRDDVRLGVIRRAKIGRRYGVGPESGQVGLSN